MIAGFDAISTGTDIQRRIGVKTSRDEPLGRFTTMRVGGPAQFWVEPETEEGFARLVHFTTERGIPIFVMGRGSNLLVRDGGVRGVVILLHNPGGALAVAAGAKW